MLKPGSYSRKLLLRYSRVTAVLHYPVLIFWGQYILLTSPQGLQKQKVASSYAAFAMNDTEQVTTLYEYEKIFAFHVRWMTALFCFYKEMAVPSTSI